MSLISCKEWKNPITTMTKNVKSKNQAIVANGFRVRVSPWSNTRAEKKKPVEAAIWAYRKVGLLTEFYGKSRFFPVYKY